MSANPALFFGTKDSIFISVALRVATFTSTAMFLLGIVA